MLKQLKSSQVKIYLNKFDDELSSKKEKDQKSNLYQHYNDYLENKEVIIQLNK